MGRGKYLHLTKGREAKLFYGYMIVVAAFVIMVVIFGTSYSFGVFFKPLLTEFGWTRAMTSGAFSLCWVMQGLLGLVMGRLTDRFGPRLVMTVCGFCLGSGYLLMSQIGLVWHLYIFYGVLIGIGMSGCWVSLNSTVARWFAKRRGMMTGVVMAGIGAGTMIMTPIANQLILAYGWRNSYIIIGVLSSVFIVVAAQFLKRDPGQMRQMQYGADEVQKDSTDLQLGGASLQEAIRTRQLWMSCAIFFCFGFCLYIIVVHIVPHTIDLGISETIAASILAAIGGVSVAGKVIMGITADRIGNRLTIIISFIFMSVALFWVIAAREVWMLYLFTIIFGFAYGGLAAAQSPIMAELFGLRSVGIILGIISCSFTFGGAVSPFLAGGLFDTTGDYRIPFLVAGAVAVIGLILTILLTPIGGNRH